MSSIVRITLFKIPDPAVVQEAIQKYSTLTQDAIKDGKQYIQLASANPTYQDPRSQGYTLLARTVFESKEAMDYYDNECEAHSAIKHFVKPNVTGPPLVMYMDG
ncbi:hypothetical protein BKA66DRAFT_417720 [Pyrenochaeta sp. MPI-SDFR-AT-0127]|nr:hypothetical protein BKA66DRAFT_417720 [Pyrenochaeta sp. MPI-SDFR-AT-0127]